MRNTYSKYLFLFFRILAFAGTLYYFRQIQWAVAILASYLFTGVGRSGFYHRYLSHRSFEVNTFWKAFGLACGGLSIGGDPISWVAIHRQHHAHTDTEEDPHSPRFLGKHKFLLLEFYLKPKMNYVRDLLKDPMVLFFQRNYLNLFLLYFMTSITMDALFFAGSGQAFVSLFAFPIVFGVIHNLSFTWFNHSFGYRNFPSQSNETNNLFSGMLLTGEGWHNNHHANPKALIMGHHWWEIDLVGSFCSLIAKEAKEYASENKQI